MKLPSDLIDLLAAFDDARVEYLLVGGQAVALHGHPRFTKDADLWIRDSAENIERCQRALDAFGAPPRDPRTRYFGMKLTSPPWSFFTSS